MLLEEHANSALEIHKKVLAAEEKKAFVKRAVKQMICPECGGHLNLVVDGGEEFEDEFCFKDYTCQDCDFKHFSC